MHTIFCLSKMLLILSWPTLLLMISTNDCLGILRIDEVLLLNEYVLVVRVLWALLAL